MRAYVGMTKRLSSSIEIAESNSEILLNSFLRSLRQILFSLYHEPSHPPAGGNPRRAI
jgi:hypothetical protein